MQARTLATSFLEILDLTLQCLHFLAKASNQRRCPEAFLKFDFRAPSTAFAS